MSLVMAFATDHFTVISGDYRRTHIDSDDIYFDDTPKSFQLTDKVLGGFTGDCDVTHYLVKELQNVSKKATLEAVTTFIKKKLKKVKQQDTQQTIILSGIRDNGKIAIFVISHHNVFKTEKIQPSANEIKWHYAFSYVDPEEDIQSMLSELEQCTPESIVEMTRKVNKLVSEKDVRVSEKCIVHTLSKCI